MSDTPEDIVRRANQMIKDPGFLGCHVVSKAPQVYAYTFDCGPNAEAFKASVEMITNFKYLIRNSEPNVVLEQR